MHTSKMWKNEDTEVEVIERKKQSYIRKWNALFDRSFSQWISFKPSEGTKVYPCYSCRDMFGSKNSFVDHINRRGMLIQYTCPECPVRIEIVFYNPCSFLLHARMHFSNTRGEIDLENVLISVLPVGLAGFFQHPNIPLLYNGKEDKIGLERVLNTRFYTPLAESEGKRIVVLKPLMLLFYQPGSPQTESTRLILKQMSLNVPCCTFIMNQQVRQKHLQLETVVTVGNIQTNISIENHSNVSTHCNNGDVKMEPEFEEFCLKSDDEVGEESSTPESPLPNLYANCPECCASNVHSMLDHFRGNNKPTKDFLKCKLCKYVAATKCSLAAHHRIHTTCAPFVCPECGKSFDVYKHLIDHLDFVCFHLAKLVRYKCMARNCGKIFATSTTYAHHFLIHLHLQLQCGTCQSVVYTENEFNAANKSHDCRLDAQKLYKCTMCFKLYDKDNFLDHVHKHCKDTTQRIYVYNCKFCKSYFRSRETYAVHFIRCSQSFKNGLRSSAPKVNGSSNSDGVTSTVNKFEYISLPVIEDVTTPEENGHKGPTDPLLTTDKYEELKDIDIKLEGGCVTELKNVQIFRKRSKIPPVEIEETDPLALTPGPAKLSYIFKCTFCHNIFTTRFTYTGHLLKCNKRFRTDSLEQTKHVQNSSKKYGRRKTSDCKKQISMVKCVLCKEIYSILEIRDHLTECSVKHEDRCRKDESSPLKLKIVSMEQSKKLTSPKLLQENSKSEWLDELKTPALRPDELIIPVKANDNNLTPSPASSHSSRGDCEVRRKRKKLFSPSKSKKLALEIDEPMPEDPIIFDGMYRCKLCSYSDIDREMFQEHVLVHRDVSTSYQCMECGECFVVRPSLIKHLNYMHLISDTEQYFLENDCFDKVAVRELVEHMRMVPGESDEPLKENQCKVCRKEFHDELELNRHFRVHGMAFLMKNLK